MIDCSVFRTACEDFREYCAVDVESNGSMGVGIAYSMRGVIHITTVIEYVSFSFFFFFIGKKVLFGSLIS